MERKEKRLYSDPNWLSSQELFLDDGNQVFFGGVGKWMVMGLMTKAEKVRIHLDTLVPPFLMGQYIFSTL